MRTSILPVCLLGLLSFLAGPAGAQAVYGTIIGTVTDVSGAAVVGAKVTATNINQGVSTSVTTNDSGNYTLTQLAPGQYSIAVEGQGFSRFVQQNVTVTVGLSTRVDAALQVGKITEEITVSAAPPGLQTDRAEVDTTLGGRQITQLPVLNRNFTNLTLLVPGAQLNTFQHAPSENPQGSTLVNTNGQEFAGTNYLLDGMNNNDSVLGIVMVNPPIDSVGETSIATSNYDAEFTQAGGAVVRVETRSGSNQLHGSAFEFLQNNIFQARDSFSQGLHDPGTPAPPNRGIPELRWNQFGGSLGGPAIRDKLFWFGDYQGTYRRIGASQTLRVPTAAERTGNLSDLGVPVYNPATGNADGTGRQPFPNATIPSSMIAGPASTLLNALPSPNLTPANPADNNYATSAVEDYDTQQFDTRVDGYATSKLRMFGRYSYLGASLNAPGPFGLYGGPAFSTWGFTGASDARNQNLVAAANYSASPTLLGDFRFGYSRYRVRVNPLDIDQTLADQVGMPGLNIQGRPDTFGLPDLNINGNGGFQMGYRCNCPLDQREFIYDYVSNWTKVFRNHTIKFGGTYEHAGNRRLPSDDHRAGLFDFDPGVTSIAPSGSGGLGLASFLLGLPDHFRRFGQISTDQEDRQNRMFFFGQDTWRITPKLTLSFGLRWDTWFPDYSLNAGQGGRYDVTDNLVRIPGVGGISLSGDSQTQWTNFSPRFAIAYALGDKTVVRTGYGRSYFQGTFGWTFNNLAADIYPSVVTQDMKGASSFTAVFPITTGPPAIVFPAIPQNGLLPLPDGIGNSYIPSDQKIPYVDQWNFTIERQLAPNLNLSVGYVGNIGRHLNSGFQLNSAIPGPGDFNPRRPLFNQFGITQGIFDKCDCSSSNYNAVQVRAEKRIGGSYSLLASYTYSRTMDFGEFGTPTNQYDARQDYGPADFDRTQVLTVAHTWILPFGKGHKYLSNAQGIGRALADGWQFNGITTLESGLPFSPALSNNSSLNSDMSMRPDITGDPMSGISQSRLLWFNPAAYSVPGPYLFGNAARNSLRGPNLFTADLSLAKSFPVTERVSLQFRWEVFNAFNRTNLALPSTAVDAGQAGRITDITSPMRNMQFGARLAW
ncbi:MAG TPA: TonB-dependent receptor [Bryobacteraceae bacterium]|nr:TonB-dependent receptor [Bryobacteraceae bacterium]